MDEAIGDERNGVSVGGFKVKAIKFTDGQVIVFGLAKALRKIVNIINFAAKKK